MGIVEGMLEMAEATLILTLTRHQMDRVATQPILLLRTMENNVVVVVGAFSMTIFFLFLINDSREKNLNLFNVTMYTKVMTTYFLIY